MFKIDAHQHFWEIARGDYYWIKQNDSILFRDYLPIDLQSDLYKHGFTHTILVQATSTIKETEYLLNLYEKNDFIAGVVGWLDLDSEHFLDAFTKFRKYEGFVGIRPMLQDIKETDWLLRPKVLYNMKFLADQGFPLDLLIQTRHLNTVINFLKIVPPNMKVVIDHIAKPLIKEQTYDPWMEQMKKIAQFRNVYCKISGLVNEAGESWSYESILPYIEHIYNVFGIDRIIYGSDWPVCLSHATYDQTIEIVDTLLRQHNASDDDFQKVYGKNALKFYSPLRMINYIMKDGLNEKINW